MVKQSFRTFTTLWLGQLASVIGSGLTGFALGVWVFQETGSVTLFSFIVMAAVVPGVLAAPFAGYVVDKWKRKYVMIAADTIAGISTMVILLLLMFDALEVWHIFLTSAIASFSSSFQLPAYQSTVSLLVPKKHLGRANGMVQMADSLSMLIAPLAAGFLLGLIGLEGIIMIDLFTFLVAIVTLIAVKFPELAKETDVKKTKFIKEALKGWTYIKARPALVGLLFYFAFVNFLLGYLNVLIQPLILMLSDEKALGMVISISGGAMLLGGVVLSIWGGMKDKMKQFLLFGTLSAVGLSIMGLSSSITVITIGMILSLGLIPFGNAAVQEIWQRKVHANVQGRVFALRRMIGLSLSPIAYLTAGPVTEKIFNPLMSENGILSNNLGLLFGVGEGRGIGLLFFILGILWMITGIGYYAHPRIRHLDLELPDAIGGQEEAVNEKTIVDPKIASAEA